MNTKNTSRIPASYVPHDYKKARFGASLADADLPLPDPSAPQDQQTAPAQDEPAE